MGDAQRELDSELEIPPDVIEAGVATLALWQRDESMAEDVVEAVFRSMLAAMASMDQGRPCNSTIPLGNI